MATLTDDERSIIPVVRDFVDRQVRPVARELEHADTHPEHLIEQMKRMGIFGLAIPEPYGHAPASMPCYALITEELSRGWMSLAGAMGGHTVVAKLLLAYGTEEQKQRYLPGMATGEIRAAIVQDRSGGGTGALRDQHPARRAPTGPHCLPRPTDARVQGRREL